MNVSDLIEPSFSYRLILTLMHFFWQGSLLALLAALGDMLLNRASASRRYTLHVAVLTIMVACVAVTFSRIASPVSVPSVSTKLPPIEPITELIVAGRDDVDSSGSPSTLTPAIVGMKTPLPAVVGTDEVVELPLVRQERPSGDGDSWQQLQHYAPEIAVLYFVGCGLLLGRLIRGTWVAHRLRRLTTTVSDDSLIATLQRQSKELGLRVMPRAAWCAEVSIPLVIGIFKPMILLPAAAATGLSPDQLQALITHELAHIRRYDLLVNLLQRIVESMLFFHPAVWYISRRVSCEREQACDELVLATGCERLRYADALVRMAELSSSLRSLRATASATSLAASGASSSEFKRRVLKVLSAPTSSDLRPSRIALLVIMALLVGAAVSASRFHFHVLAETPPNSTSTETMPPKGLEFLKPYPNLHGLSLEMTEPRFLEIVKHQELKIRKTVEGDKVTHHIALGDGHTLIVMFDKDAKCRGIQRVPGEDGNPIRVVLKLNRKEFLLGESIAVEYEMTNHGPEEAEYGKGGFYPDLRINDGFRMLAVKVSEKGQPIGEPVETWPMPQNFGGRVGGFKLKPNETYSTTLFVTRYLKFLEPGRYRLRVSNVDRLEDQPKSSYSSGETILVLKQPTAVEAREVFERMKRAPRQAYDDNAMKFLPDAADFQAMIQPIYLPILSESAAKRDLDVLQSLERMERVEANEVLVDALQNALERDDWQTARACFQHVRKCLPFPNWYNEPLSDYEKINRDRVARTWRTDFAPVLTRLAKRLNVEVASLMRERKAKSLDADAKDEEFLKVFRNGHFPPEHPQSLLIDIDFIYRCVGQPEDFADCLAAFTHSIELTKTLPLETHQYFRPRGSASGFGHTVICMLGRGAKAPIPPTSLGEAAAFAIALRQQDSFRPAGWQSELMKWLKSDSPYLAELILNNLPTPYPAEVLDYLPTALAHDYIDLQIAACHVAKNNPRPAYREPLQGILDTAKDPYLRKYSVDAARANGINAKYDADAPFVDAEKENGVSQTSPPKGLEFLKPYPKLHGLSLEMTEPQFLEIVKRQELKTRKTVEGDRVTHHLALGDGHTLFVMFDKDAKCRGIQRVRGEDSVEETISPTKAVRDVNAPTLLKPEVVLPDHWILQAVEFDNDNRELVTASNQSFITIRRWDLAGMRLISEIKLQADKHGRAVRVGTFRFSGDRRRVIAATDVYIGIWDTATGKLLKQLPFEPKDGIYDCVINMLDCTLDLSVIVGNRALPGRLTLSYDAHVIVWDGVSGNVLQTIIDKGATDLKAIDLSADGKRLVTTNGSGAQIWETSTGQLLRSIPNDNTGRKPSEPDVSSQYTSHVWSVQFSPDGKQLAIGDILGVRLLDTTSGKLLQQLDGPYRYSSSGSPGLVFSPDCQRLARLGTQEQIEGDKHRYVVPIWSTQTGAKLYVLHTESNAAAFSDDGQRLAIAFSDMQQALSVWSLNDDEQDAVKTSGPGPHSRVDRVEENGHYVGKKAAEYIEQFKPTWGEAKLGLQYGIALTTPQRQFHNGERVPLVVFFRNASDNPIKFDTVPDFFGNVPKVLNAQGELLSLDNIPLLGSIPHYHEELNPGEALGPFYLSIGLGENPRPNQQHWHPYLNTPIAGTYTLTHSVLVNVAGTKEGPAAKKDEITSSKIAFEILE